MLSVLYGYQKRQRLLLYTALTEMECVYCAVRTGSLYIILRSAHTVYLCVLCGSVNKQRLFPYTALTDWFVQPRWSVFTARYGLNVYDWISLQKTKIVLNNLQCFPVMHYFASAYLTLELLKLDHRVSL